MTQGLILANTPRKRILSTQQVHNLRAVCDTNISVGKRDLAILDSMLYQGMRLGEVANLQFEQIISSGNKFFIQLKRSTEPIEAHTRWLQSLKIWLDQRSASLQNNHGPIFVRIRKSMEICQKPLSKRTVSYLVARYGNLAGIAPLRGDNRVFPTDLRRTCGRSAYEHGANLLSIAAFLGFNHLESAARFIKVINFADPNAAVDRIQYY